MQFNRNQFPAGGGWTFFQPQTGWNNPMAMISFDGSVKAIVSHRRANPAITNKHALSTDYNAVANELENYTRARLGMPPALSAENPVPKMPAPSALASLSGRAAGAVEAIKKLASGAAVLFEWEESRTPPVAAELATKRASICAGADGSGRCPKNGTQESVAQVVTAAFADGMRKRLQRLHDLNLTTPHDAHIGVCTACLCPLALKVHTPMELILKRLKPNERAELDPRCWILQST